MQLRGCPGEMCMHWCGCVQTLVCLNALKGVNMCLCVTKSTLVYNKTNCNVKIIGSNAIVYY